jgi:hypothetical protein
MDANANPNNREKLASLVCAWLDEGAEGKPILDELHALGVLSAEEREAVHIEPESAEFDLVHVCQFNTCDRDSTWLEVNRDGSCLLL